MGAVRQDTEGLTGAYRSAPSLGLGDAPIEPSRAIPSPSTRADLALSILQWTPVIAPSGTTFYTGSLFPAWCGSLLIGGLVAQGVVRLTLRVSRSQEKSEYPLGNGFAMSGRVRMVQYTC